MLRKYYFAIGEIFIIGDTKGAEYEKNKCSRSDC